MNLETMKSIAVRLDEQYRVHAARLSRSQPWFARFTLREQSGPKDFYVGTESATDERILKWNHPMALAVAQAELGDAIILPRQFTDESRTLESRAEVDGEGGELSRIRLLLPEGEANFVRTEAGLVDVQRAAASRVIPKGLDDIIGQLTPAQYKLITAERGAPLIIQGRAGSGKTSVGLYRVAWLTHAPEGTDVVPVAPGRVLVLMFNKALQLYVQRLMGSVGLGSVRVDTYHGWALEEIKRGYRGELLIETQQFPGYANASKLKKQLGILKVVEAFVARQTVQVSGWLDKKLVAYDPTGHWVGRFQGDEAPLVRRLIVLRGSALKARDACSSLDEKARLVEIHRVLSHAVERLIQYKEELFKLLTDRDLLALHLPNATPAELDDLIAYQTALQMGDREDRQPGARVAFDDLAILLRLMQLKNGGLPNRERDDEVNVYEHLLIDEAQDFGAVELSAILASVRSRAGVTIVGDSNQKILPEADFIGWDALAAELGAGGIAVARLEVPHRSTGPIMRLADQLVGDTSCAARPGPMPRLSMVSQARTVERVAERIREVYIDNPHAHIAVVCGSRKVVDETALALFGSLSGRDIPVRKGHNAEFTFAPGVTVTNLRQIKGLEFDAVLALEVEDTRYPDNEQGRRWLYTLVTRAREVLHLFATEKPCALVRVAIESGLIELDSGADVPKADFTAEEYEPF